MQRLLEFLDVKDFPVPKILTELLLSSSWCTIPCAFFLYKASLLDFSNTSITKMVLGMLLASSCCPNMCLLVMIMQGKVLHGYPGFIRVVVISQPTTLLSIC